MLGQPSELVQSPSENDSGSLSRNLGLVRHVVFRRHAALNVEADCTIAAEGLDPSGNDGLLPAISGRREDFPAVRCGTDGLRAGVVNPPGLTCAALPLSLVRRQRIKR